MVQISGLCLITFLVIFGSISPISGCSGGSPPPASLPSLPHGPTEPPPGLGYSKKFVEVLTLPPLPIWTNFCRDQNTQKCPEGSIAYEYTVLAHEDCQTNIQKNRRGDPLAVTDLMSFQIEEAEIDDRIGCGKYGKNCGKGRGKKNRGKKSSLINYLCSKNVSFSLISNSSWEWNRFVQQDLKP